MSGTDACDRPTRMIPRTLGKPMCADTGFEPHRPPVLTLGLKHYQAALPGTFEWFELEDGLRFDFDSDASIMILLRTVRYRTDLRFAYHAALM
eukprot:3824982-Rhodomonas_salina.9